MMSDDVLNNLRTAFAQQLSDLDLHLPDCDLHELRQGSMANGRNGMLFYVIVEEDGRAYLEYYVYPRKGRAHGRIDDEGSHVQLPELSLEFEFDEDTPGNYDLKEVEMRKRNMEILVDMRARGLLDETAEAVLRVNCIRDIFPDMRIRPSPHKRGFGHTA